MRRAALFLAGAGLVASAPWLWMSSSVVGAANLGTGYALVAMSLVLLTGWVGQISLGHAALVGVGAYATGWAAGTLGLPFPASLPISAALAGAAAAILGVVALRVRGLYLAVATLVFSWMASEFLFRQPWVTAHDSIPSRVVGGIGSLPSFDLSDRRIFYVLGWAVVAIVGFAAHNLRSSRTGRAFMAVRGSEMAAASLGIDVMRTKLIAFATSGAIAGIAGNLIMTDSRVVTADQFGFNFSLLFLAMAVIGGLSSLGGALASALLFAGLTEVFFRVQFLGGFLEIVSSLLLAVTLLVSRGGLASMGRSKPAQALVQALRRRTAAQVPHGPDVAAIGAVFADGTVEPSAEAEAGTPSQETRPRDERPALIEATGITVRFGGLTAVLDASLRVHEGEIVGLIGPNGAGKTTLFNAIAGFNHPASGTINLYGRDVTGFPVHERARAGLARTFQQIQLLPQLTVAENLLVATNVNNASTYLHNLLASERSIAAERAAREQVDRTLERLDLHEVAGRRAADLPFGVLRMVEVARALVTGFRVMMLDEPASGLDNTETDRLIEILRAVRTMGVTMLLIEHDVRMVTQISDYMYVLDQGRILASGVPEQIQRDASVIAAYLGEPEREEVA